MSGPEQPKPVSQITGVIRKSQAESIARQYGLPDETLDQTIERVGKETPKVSHLATRLGLDVETTTIWEQALGITISDYKTPRSKPSIIPLGKNGAFPDHKNPNSFDKIDNINSPELTNNLHNNNSPAWNRLDALFGGFLYSVVYRFVGNHDDAKEVKQEVYLKILRNIAAYDPEKKFSNWVLEIATNTAIDFLRKRNYRERRIVYLSAPQSQINHYGSEPGELLDTIEDPDPNPLESLISLEEKRHMQKILRTLPPHHRIIMLLRYSEDLSYKQIADITGLPESTIRMRLYQGRKLLRDLFQKEEVKGYEYHVR